MSFEVNESGNIVPNAWVSCDGCGAQVPLTILVGTADEVENDPTIRVICEDCFVSEAVDQILSATGTDDSQQVGPS